MFHRQLQESTSPEQEQNKTNQNISVERDNMISDGRSASAGTEEVKKEVKDDSPQASARQFDLPEKTPFQRSGGVTASRPAGGYVSSYPGAENISTSSSQTGGRRLVVGPGITMSGEIEACDMLVVKGTVEAALKGASVLDVSEEGTFYGTVEINEAVVSGRVEGDITVNGRLTITSTGSVTGSVSYKELVIEAGATLDGKITPLAGKVAVKSESKSAVVKGSAPNNDNEGESNERPFATGATAAAAG